MGVKLQAEQWHSNAVLRKCNSKQIFVTMDNLLPCMPTIWLLYSGTRNRKQELRKKHSNLHIPTNSLGYSPMQLNSINNSVPTYIKLYSPRFKKHIWKV